MRKGKSTRANRPLITCTPPCALHWDALNSEQFHDKNSDMNHETVAQSGLPAEPQIAGKK
jgi:hypothetical protein